MTGHRADPAAARGPLPSAGSPVAATGGSDGGSLAQDPTGSGHDGMPPSAGGLVDAGPIATQRARPLAAEAYRSTNAGAPASRAELQALNAALAARNGQLQDSLARQRTTSDDLQNVLHSTDVATLFLDRALRIRFFTPATRRLFNVIPGDIGRPLSDLQSLAEDALLPDDARAVLETRRPIEREIESRSGAWFLRRILAYRAQDDRVEGVVITFTDISERKQVARALEAARQQAEQADRAKSRFLAAASHDLRQPLQTLALVQSLLADMVEGEAAQTLIAMLDPTLSAMTGMLNSLLDINQIDAGTLRVEVAEFRLGDILQRLKGEFAILADAQGLALHVVDCSAVVRSDPRLLEQMIRSLLSNALKYTSRGKVLLGCRRHGDRVSVDILDTGIGMAGAELQAIFDAYHQIDTPARERGRSLGLGLSIVQRLGSLLGHRIRVKSDPDKGSVFAIEVALVPAAVPTPGGPVRP